MVAMEGVSYLLASVYLFSFLGLSAVASRDAGRSIWLIGKGNGRERLSMRFVSLLFASLFVWPLCLWLFGLLPGDPLRRLLDRTAFDLIGHFLVAIGACIAIVSQMHMGASWRVGASAGELGPFVESGPFAISRNPVFVGQIILAVGLFFAFPSLVMAAISFGYVAVLRWQVAVEERALGASYPEAYALYCSRVRRWIGRGPAARPNNG